MPIASRKKTVPRTAKITRTKTRRKPAGTPSFFWPLEKVTAMLDRLEKAYPEAHQELNFSNPLELLIATILAAQCTDKLVNEVTASLFKKYHKAEDYVQVPATALEQDIKPVTFFRNKTRSIQNCCQQLVEKYNGNVPANLEALLELPGVGRKTANIVLGHAFGQQAIAVDTHVKRLSTERLFLSQQTDPDKIELDLQQILAPKRWTRGTILLQWHGRYTCQARRPLCNKCVIVDLCPYEEKTI